MPATLFFWISTVWLVFSMLILIVVIFHSEKRDEFTMIFAPLLISFMFALLSLVKFIIELR